MRHGSGLGIGDSCFLSSSMDGVNIDSWTTEVPRKSSVVEAFCLAMTPSVCGDEAT